MRILLAAMLAVAPVDDTRAVVYGETFFIIEDFGKDYVCIRWDGGMGELTCYGKLPGRWR